MLSAGRCLVTGGFLNPALSEKRALEKLQILGITWDAFGRLDWQVLLPIQVSQEVVTETAALGGGTVTPEQQVARAQSRGGPV